MRSGLIYKVWAVLNRIGQYRRPMVVLTILGFAVVGASYVLGLWFWMCVGLYVGQWLGRHRKSLRETRSEDWANPVKWLSVVYAEVMGWIMPVHVLEQMSLRIWDGECRTCVKGGACTVCGCDMKKVLVPWETCSGGNWGEIIEREKLYRQVRAEFPVRVSVVYEKEDQK